MTPSDFPNALAFAIHAAGGMSAAATACGRSCQALNKWRLAACLPRTDYTGETEYAERLSIAAEKRGYFFDPAWLKAQSSPLHKTSFLRDQFPKSNSQPAETCIGHLKSVNYGAPGRFT